MAAAINVSQAERIGSAALGAGLLVPLLKKRSALSWTAAALGGALLYRGASGHCGVYSALGISSTGSEPVEVKQAITIGKPAEKLYALWRSPEAFTRIMRDFAEVTPLDQDHARWAVKLPGGHAVEFETEVVEERPGQRIRWRTTAGSRLQSEVSLQLSQAEGDRGTVATLTIHFDPAALPAGGFLRAVAKAVPTVSRSGATKVLRNFKALAETGELPTLAHNVSGRASDGREGDRI